MAAGGVGSLVAVPFVVPENRVDYYTGAVSAAFGVFPFVIFPLPVLSDAPELHATAAAVDNAHLCATLSRAEDALVRNAREERLQRAWWVHAGDVVFNAGVLLFLGLGYHHWASGLINGGAGLAVGEAMIFTSPIGSIDDLAAYRRAAVPERAVKASALRWAGIAPARPFRPRPSCRRRPRTRRSSSACSCRRGRF